MWKQVILYTLSGFAALILVFAIVFSNEIVDLFFDQPSSTGYYMKENRAQRLWETTLGEKLFILREKISLCNLRGGKRVRTTDWRSEGPIRYGCNYNTINYSEDLGLQFGQ